MHWVTILEKLIEDEEHLEELMCLDSDGFFATSIVNVGLYIESNGVRLR